MKSPIRSHFAASVLGGVVVAGAFLALGVTGRRSTQTIIEESPVAAQPASSGEAGLTPHAIYERDAPGVVFVRAQIIQQVQDPFDLFPEQERSTSTGSGFLIDDAGDILTNYHVIEGANRSNGVSVQFEDNVTRTAAVVGQDPNNDLALLKVNMAGVPQVAPAPARRLDHGPGRRPDAGDRQPVRARPHADQRDRVGAAAPDPGPQRVQHRQRDPDRRADQPRQLGRPVARRRRTGDRDQLADRDRRRRRTGQRRDRVRGPDQHRQGVPAAPRGRPPGGDAPTSAPTAIAAPGYVARA